MNLTTQPRQESVPIQVLPVNVEELLRELGVPGHARVFANGQAVESLEIRWLETPDLPIATVHRLGIVSGVARAPDALHDRKEIVCTVDRCKGRKINGQGPMVGHIRWHEKKDDDVPLELYDEAGIDRPRKRGSRARG